MATVFMSVVTRLSDLDDQKPGVNIQTEGHTLTPPSAWNGLKIQRHLVAPHHIHHPISGKETNTWLAWDSVLFGIQVTSTKDGGVTPLPPHAWQAPVVEDMVQDGKSCLTEAVVTSPGQAVLFYGWRLLGEDWAWVRHEMTHSHCQEPSVGLANKPNIVPNQYAWVKAGSWTTQAITKGHIEPRGPGCPCSTCINTVQLQQSRPISMTSKPPNSCYPIGGAQTWPQASVPRTRPGATVRLRLRLGAMRVMGSPTPITFALARL